MRNDPKSAPTHYEYEMSKRISAEGYPFYAILSALIRQADDHNLAALRMAFPDVVAMFEERYHNAGGLSNDELIPF